jgi:BirA family biotin operon repressor/biotin-[acetyl-CoA-carboxylase] ligase
VTRPAVPARALPLAPLVAGLAAVEAARGVAGVPAVLKWPNDVLVAGAKLGGILVERVGDAVVIGVGLNVSTRRDELPTDAATSVALAGGTADREPIAAELLRALDRRLADWERGGGAPAAVLPAYRAVCATMGARVRVTRPDGAVVTGTALDVTDDGLLVVRGDDGVDRTWSAGDVTHVRTEG